MRISVYDTSQLNSVEQFAYWNDAICEVFTELACQRPGSLKFSMPSYRGSLECLNLGEIQINKVSCDASQVNHGSIQVAKSCADVDLMHIQVSGESLNSQNGQEAHLRPGEFTICSSTQPYFVRFDRQIEMLVVRIPHVLISRRFQIDKSLYGHHFSASEQLGFSRLIADTVANIWKYRYSIATDSQAASLADSVMCLLASHLDSFNCFGLPAYRDPKIRLLETLQAFVLARLSDPSLSPSFVAGANGISTRYLRQIFAGHETTCSEYIMERRLIAAAQYLEDPNYSHMRVIDIAFRCGFKSASHFSRVFKYRFSVPPTKYRVCNQ